MPKNGIKSEFPRGFGLCFGFGQLGWTRWRGKNRRRICPQMRGRIFLTLITSLEHSWPKKITAIGVNFAEIGFFGRHTYRKCVRFHSLEIDFFQMELTENDFEIHLKITGSTRIDWQNRRRSTPGKRLSEERTKDGLTNDENGLKYWGRKI